MNKSTRTQKLILGLAFVAAPVVAMADPSQLVEPVITAATGVFALAAALGISILGYRIFYRIVSRFSK
jgi:hypothetical protein